MQNKRLLMVLGGATIFGLIAAVLVSRYLATYAEAYTSNANNIVVAKVDIPLGTKITAEQLTLMRFPRDAAPDGAFDSRDKLIGRIAVTSIAAREAITDFKLAPEGSAGGLSAVIPEGYRAMTVKVDDVVGISGFVMPGSLVDIVCVIDPPADKNSGQGRISKIVLQSIKVLANGQNIDRPKSDRDASSVQAVTLQVTPEQAEKLALAANEGRLQLVMRNSIDQEDTHTTGANKNSLLTGDRAMPAPEPGSFKSEQPAATTVSPKPHSSTARVYTPRVSSAPVAAAPAAPMPAAPRRSSVELYEGVKKSNVDFP